MLRLLPLLALVATFVLPAQAHMSLFTPSMYGVGPNFAYEGLNPVVPIGPNLETQDEWWFRGPSYRALAPGKGNVTELPAGGSITMEIACHVAFTSYGVTPTVAGSTLDACPGNSGAYHSGVPGGAVDDSMLSGCALGIADVDDIGKVTMDNLAIFSVQQQCVKSKLTEFEIPQMMPPCTGSKCICGWFWLAANGTANFYMTAFDCNVTNSLPSATPIAPPSDPVFCAPGNSTCKLNTGSKRPLYAYNKPTNVFYPGAPATFNDNRPGYHSSWSFENGAQNDIFLPSSKNATVVSSSSSLSLSNNISRESARVADDSTIQSTSTRTRHAVAAATANKGDDASTSVTRTSSTHISSATHTCRRSRRRRAKRQARFHHGRLFSPQGA